jgi:hypothetical protein
MPHQSCCHDSFVLAEQLSRSGRGCNLEPLSPDAEWFAAVTTEAAFEFALWLQC